MSPRTSLVFTLLSASCLVSCQRQPDPIRVRTLLIVVPGATEVNLTQPVVAYKVADPYPAEATIKALDDALARAQCAVSDQDPFNPQPGLPFNRWTEFTRKEGEASRLVWMGAWTCQPDGDVVAFGLQTTRDAAHQPASAIEVKGAYYSSAQMREVRQMSGRVTRVAGPS